MWVFVVGVFAFLYAPMVVMSVFSVNASKVQTLPFSGFTAEWYRALLHDAPMQDAIRFGLQVSATTVLIGAVVGVYLAFSIDRLAFPGKNAFQALVAVPLALPGIVLGISLVLVFRAAGIASGFITIVAGHATFVTPLIMFVVLQRLRSLDRNLEHASMDLGAGWIRTFWHVTLPEIRLAVIAGCLLGFTLSFDEITVTLFLAGNELTLPVFVWTLLRFGFTPEVNAAFTIIGTFSIASIVAAVVLLTRGRPRRRSRIVMAEEAIA
jgi:ABC-type spermidine/putrescine transport system permease subunit II